MTVAVVILGAIVLALLVMRRETATEHTAEQRMLLEQIQTMADRIQHPESRIVEVKDPIIHEIPKDEAEMAYVGGFVPDGISVGMTDG